MEYNKIYLIVIIGLVLFSIFTCKNTEGFADAPALPSFSSDQEERIRQLIYETYRVDVTAIKNLADVANKLREGGVTIPGNLTTNANMTVKKQLSVNTDATISGDITTTNIGAVDINLTGKITVNDKIETSNGDINVVKGKIKEGGNDLVPRGTIVAYHGATAPAGWALCDGTQDTPDLRGKFIIGTGQGRDLTARTWKETGGAETVTLTQAQIPSHTHGGVQNTEGCRDIVAAGKSGCWMAGPMYFRNSDPTGGGQAHENMPPFYALTYIMKL